MPPPDALIHPTKRNQETRHFKVQVVHRREKILGVTVRED